MNPVILDVSFASLFSFSFLLSTPFFKFYLKFLYKLQSLYFVI